MNWTVETLNTRVDEEIEALPVDMRARLSRIAALITTVGLENVREPHIKHIEGQLWELRIKGQRWHIASHLCHSKIKAAGDCARIY